MKLIHLSDLHLGKRVNEVSMLEEQRHILEEILKIIDIESPDVVLISGDIYDKSIPSAEAVELCDDFIVRLSKRKLQVFIISGNHDSPERLAFGNRILEKSGVHISPVYNGRVEPVSLRDEYGAVDIFMLPFIKPATVRRFFPESEIADYTDAVRASLESMELSQDHRSVLLAHQFVTGAQTSKSEEINVGGSENVDASAFEGFDYVALGHLHGSQNVGSERIRYCGTPLKYSFSELRHTKSVTVVTLLEKGSLSLRTVPLVPLHDFAQVRGTYEEITAKSYYEGTTLQDDYVQIILTEEQDIPDAAAKLRVIYHNLMQLEYDNTRTRTTNSVSVNESMEQLSPAELFSCFYEQQNNRQMSAEQRNFITELVESIWEANR